MALTVDPRIYRDALLPLPPRSSSKDQLRFHMLPESAMQPVKDEAFEHTPMNDRAPLRDGNDYMIIDYQHRPYHSTPSVSHAAIDDGGGNGFKKPRKTTPASKHMLTMANLGSTLGNFDHRSTISPNQASATVKQQPFSPPPFHGLPNGYFSHHHHHAHHRQHSSPSPDHEPISPLSDSLVENSLASNLVPPANIGGASAGPDDKRRCAVCSDIASGYHYGVWSCEGCKAFFKRSIQGTNEYICPATNTCTIDKHRRKSCQACRLRRCYEVGMTKGTTRRERKYRKKAVSVCKITSTSSNSNAMNLPNATNHEHNLSIATGAPRIGTPSGSHMNNSVFPSPQQHANKANMDPSRIPFTSAEFITTLSQASRLNLPAKVDNSRALTDQYFLQLLAKIFDQELVVLINWAKAMPGYTESLTLDQQVTIIEQSWLDTLILDIIERSIERNDDILHFAPDFIITRNRDLSSPGLGAICTSLFNILQAFKDPRTTHEEFIALKATILINSIPATITATKSFRLLTSQIYQALQYTCDSNPSVYHDNYTRHFTLLLQLPHIKTLSLKLVRLFVDMRAADLLPQADLLLEMLDAQDAPDLGSSFLSMNADGNVAPMRPPSIGQDYSTNASRNETLATSAPNNFSQRQDAVDQNQGAADLTVNDRTTPSPMLYANTSSEKRSTDTPPVPYYKHSDSLPNQPPTNMHFPMNNLSY